MNKNLICYFSATGTTKRVAKEVAKIVNGDLFEIEPTEKYTSEDLDWTNKQSRSSIEMANEYSRPSIKNRVQSIDNYNKIVIGFPVWWYKEPTIIDTFIEENNLENKEVYIFVTSGGSSVEGSLNHLKGKYNNINFVNGKVLNHIDESEIKEWIK